MAKPNKSKSRATPLFRLLILIEASFLFWAAFHTGARRQSVGHTAIYAATVLALAGVFYEREWHVRSGDKEVHMGALGTSSTELTTEFATEGPAEDVVKTQNETDEAASFYLAQRLISDLFGKLKGPLDGCDFQIFIFQSGILSPILESKHHEGDTPTFEVEEGVVGQAWHRDKYFYLNDDSIWDGTFNLSSDKQGRYRDLAAVAALPIKNAAGQKIAVLSGASKDPKTKLLSEDGLKEHLWLAECSARILVDLLKWFDDSDDTVYKGELS